MYTQAQAEKLVRSWGFSHVFTWTDGPFWKVFTLSDWLKVASEISMELISTGGFRNAHYPPHSHSTLTTHLILCGELVISYPGTDEDGIHADDTGGVECFEPGNSSAGSENGLDKSKGETKGRKWKYGVAGRIDVDERRIHEVWVGGEGCTYVIGEK